MSTKKIAQKTIKWITTGLLTVGAVISIGLVGYCGMLAVTPSLIAAWVVFALAGFIEGEVYLQNIGNGIDSLKLLGKHGLDALIVKSLDEQLKQEPNETASSLIKDYYQQRNYLAGFQHKKLTREQKEEKKKASQRLRRMQKMFVERVLSLANDQDDVVISRVRNNLPTLKRKIWFLRISVPICLGAGFAFGLATASALDTALLSLGIASSAAIWPLAAVACIAYTFLIYHTISDMVGSETFVKWRKKFTHWFKPQIIIKDGDKKKLIDKKYVLRVIGISALLALTISLGVLATLATAGTWWLAVKNGALLLPAFTSAANAIRNIFVPLASIATFVFTIRNSLTTVKQMVKDIRTKDPIGYIRKKFILFKQGCKELIYSHPIDFLKRKKQEHASNKTWAEILNPFRLLANVIRAPFLFLIFLGHLASVGLTGDRAPGLNYAGTIASAVFGALSDGFVDYHYIIGHDEQEHKPHKHEHHHTHGLIANTILKILLSPLLLAAAGWDCVMSRLDKSNQGLTAKEYFIRSLKLNFGIKENIFISNPKPKISTVFLQEEMHYRFKKQKERLKHVLIDKKLAAEKIKILDSIETSLSAQKIPEPSTYEKLKKHRKISNKQHLFAKEKSTTERIVDDVIADFKIALQA